MQLQEAQKPSTTAAAVASADATIAACYKKDNGYSAAIAAGAGVTAAAAAAAAAASAAASAAAVAINVSLVALALRSNNKYVCIRMYRISPCCTHLLQGKTDSYCVPESSFGPYFRR